MAIGKITMFHRLSIILAIFNSYVQLPEGRWLVFEILSEMYIDVLITRREDDPQHSWEEERFRVDSLKWDTLFHTYLAWWLDWKKQAAVISLGWVESTRNVSHALSYDKPWLINWWYPQNRYFMIFYLLLEWYPFLTINSQVAGVNINPELTLLKMQLLSHLWKPIVSPLFIILSLYPSALQ